MTKATLALFSSMIYALAGPTGALRTPEEPETQAEAFGETVEVESRADDLTGIAGSAGEGVVGRADLEHRPLQRPGEILETVPGMVVTQHSGGGKANQYYLRGFNLDHGTDFRISVAGVPVNLASHAHGQGYADLSFLIPELIETVRFDKGPWDASAGDFATSGSARLEYVDTLAAPLLEVAAGGLGYRRALAAASTSWREGELLGAVEIAGSDGPWRRDEDLERGNGLIRYGRQQGDRSWNLTWSGYRGSWNATDQVPANLVESGGLDRFDTLDDTTGGDSYRSSLSWSSRKLGPRGSDQVGAWLMAYGLDLYSNFTYFLDDPERGDQFEQRDRRIGVGGDWRRDRQVQLGARPVRVSLGAEARFEAIDNGLYHTAARERLATTREDEIELGVVGLWTEAEVRWAPKLRTITGVRVDGWSADVTSDLALNSGRRDDLLVSPKLSVILGPWRDAELYAHIGQGFHSNDARGATIRVDPRSLEPIERVDPLVRARAAELGLRGAIGTSWRSSLSLFGLELDSELLYIGDAGGTEASRPSRRVGIELANSWTPRSWLRLELDLAATEARFRDDDPAGDRIPGAVDRVASLNVLINDLGRWSGGMRVRHIGPRALIEDDSVRSPSTTLVHGRLAYRMSVGASLIAEVYNLLDEEVSDIEYFYESRPTPTEIPREDIHFHPAEPRSLRIGVEWRPGAR